MSYNSEGKVTREKGIGLYEFPVNYTVIDIETTGLSPANCEIIELSAIKVINGEVIDEFSSLIKPDTPIPSFIENLTGITNEMVSSASSIENVLREYIDFIGTDIIVGHNITFDLSFINHNIRNISGHDLPNDYVDTLRISRQLLHDINNHKLSTLAEYFNISQQNAHRALDDCQTTNLLFAELKKLNDEKDIEFSKLFDNCNNILEGKIVVFKGNPTLCSFDTYSLICEKANGKATTTFYSNAEYVVLGKTTYSKYKRGDYSEKMLKAIQLSEKGTLKIMSEFEFCKLLGVEISDASKTHSKLDARTLSAQTDDFDISHPLYGKVCVFTGTLDKMQRKDAMQAVLNCGGEVGNGVTKKTNYLILGCNDYCKSIKDGKSSKQKKAEEYKLNGYDIEIIDEDVFYSMLEE